MKLLILGGTVYLGRHAVEVARVRGHEVTLFNRGQTHPELFPQVERLRGDRNGDLSALKGGRWDAVIDPSGYLPASVRASCAVLAHCDYYLFISSVNAYADRTRPGLVESDAPAELPPGTPEELSGETYGPLKYRCEREVLAAFPERSAVVRAGLIVGPHDSTDRSAYWPLRLLRGGDVLAPGRAGRPIQMIDVRDLAAWLVDLAETRTSGVFNATGPRQPLTMGQFLETCGSFGDRDHRLVWVDESFLLDHQVGPYSELPLWVPERYHAFMTVDCRRAYGAGLQCRPHIDTLRAILDWARNLPPGTRESRAGLPIPPALDSQREAELLEAWRARGAVSPAAGDAAIS